MEKNGQEGCATEGEFTPLFDINDVNRFGSCPKVMIKRHDCSVPMVLPDGKKWTFTRDKLVDEKSKEPVEKATLSRVNYSTNVQEQCGGKTGK